MSHAIGGAGFHAEPSRDPAVYSHDPAYQAYQILHFAYAILPIVAGLDKFFHYLVNWDNYLSPAYSSIVGGHTHQLMLAVGVVEIIAGIGVALAPRIFSYIVALWLVGIIVNLCLFPATSSWPHYDVALRDFGLLVGALALAQLSRCTCTRERRIQS